MAQEEHILSSSHSGSGGGGGGGVGGGGGSSGGCGVSSNRSKNTKQKKVPQRGLGVAQLEKIRLEEQRKREALQAANVLANNAIGLASDAASCLPIQCPNFGPNLSLSPNSVPLPPSSTNFPTPNSLYRSAPSVPVQISNRLNEGLEEIGLQANPSPGNGNWSRLWNGEYNLEGEKPRIDHHGFAFQPQVSLPYESNVPVLPLPNVPQRSYQFQRPSSVVNASSGISPSSVLSSQMEPPSNQSFRVNNFPSSWPEEDKMVGMKRSYPFSLESPPVPSFSGNFHPTYAASKSRSDELPSCSRGYAHQTEPRNKYMRDGPLNSSPPPKRNPSEVIRDDERLNGEFLTLAPPAPDSPPSNSKHKHPFDYSGHQGPELSNFFKYLPTQENFKSQILQFGPSGSTEQSFSFFPVKSQADQTNTCVSDGGGEKGETIDLNLKL